MEDKNKDGGTSTPDNNASGEVDYKAELERVKKENADKERELIQARHKLKQKNMDDKKNKSKVFNQDDDDDDDDMDDDAAEIDEIGAQVDAKFNRVRAEDFLTKHSTNPDEVELAKYHLEHTVKSSGNPEQDAIAALSIANGPRLAKEKSELKTALLNRNQSSAMSQGGGGGGTMEVNEFNKYLTPEQLTTLRTTHRMNDKQIAMFLEKRQGAKHSIKP